MNLEELRQEINQIDDELVVLLEKRMKLVNQVATYKQETGKAVLDAKREEVILGRVADHVENPAYKDTILATFKDILKNSRAYQEQKKFSRHLLSCYAWWLASLLNLFLRYLHWTFSLSHTLGQLSGDLYSGLFGKGLPSK